MADMTERIKNWFSQYKFVLLVAAAGVVLMLLPTGSSSRTQQPEAAASDQTADPAECLEQLLSRVQGVGKVQVLLTVAEGERIIYEYDQDSSQNTDSGSLRRETVLVTDSGRNESGLIRQVIPPVYLGAVVVCQGGDQPAVKLAVVEAVTAATGLTADKVRVLKMK